jgi:PAS domain S-box-containing protein
MAKVLIVDDEKSIRRTFGEFLREAGYTVAEAEDAEVALKKLSENAFDVVVSDIILPRVTGVELLQQIHETSPTVQVVMMTGEPTVESATESLRAGAVDYLFKPINKSAILRVVANAARIKSLEDTRRRLEAENQAHRENLERLVDERTARLIESETLYQSLVENAPLHIFRKDAEGRFTFGNGQFCRSLGRSLTEILGKTDRHFYPPALAEQHRQDDQRVLEKGEAIVNREELCADAAGGARWLQTTKVPLRDTAGKVTGLVGIARDITELKRLEDQFRQAQKMEAVGQLAGGVAHDFNNLLAIIRGNAELLLMDAGGYGAEALVSLRQVIDASERAANLTRQLLLFSRKQAMQPQHLLLNELVGNLAKMLGRVIREDIRLECKPTKSLPFVFADPGMLEQVLLNLVVNARDAMPEGGRISITTNEVTLDETQAQGHTGGRAGHFVCLRVSDTGTGIVPDHLPHIFEPFFTTKEPGKGTGLGLATVYGIIKQHQGWVEVSTQIGKGTVFDVFLPVAEPSEQNRTTTSPGVDLKGGNETILLVEDNMAVRLITRKVLESVHYRILAAADSQEAIELWRQHAREIDLLLTDVIMPGDLSGRELADRLRHEKPDLRVIYMSGYSSELLSKDTDFFRRIDSSFLQKPCPHDTLLRTVRSCLDASQPMKVSPNQNQAWEL